MKIILAALILAVIYCSTAYSQPVHLGLPKDSVEILFPVSEKTDLRNERTTYFDLLIEDVNWNGMNGRLRLKFDSLSKVKGFQWSIEMKPKEAKAFLQSLNKVFGPSKGDHLPKSEKDFLSWVWSKVNGAPSAGYMFGTFSFLQGQTSNGQLNAPNDVNANWK
jgi:hypothetical protein